MGFNRDIGLEITEIAPGYSKCKIELTAMHANPIGSTHGGVIFTLADAVGGTAATSRGRWVTTITGNINYLSPAMNCKTLIGESREIKTGRTTCVYGVDITNEYGKLIAQATMTYFYLAEIREDAVTDIARAREAH